MTERIDNFTPDLFLDGPAEFLVKSIAAQLALVPQFVEVFGDNIDPYPRMDYGVRNLPALRIYLEKPYSKEAESWFINGYVQLDVIFPANLRREETQQLQSTIASALTQQFRRPTFFNNICQLVPGLNELGKVFTADHSKGFRWNDDDVPVTQIELNFRLDLRQWDLYLEQSSRTKDDPFEKTLGNLSRLITTIRAMHDDNETSELSIQIDQKTT